MANSTPTFSPGDGTILTPVGPGNDFARSVEVQADGKIVVAGFGLDGTINSFAVVRYNANGSLDTSFGNNGKVLTPAGSSNNQSYDLEVQTDGKIVVAGTGLNGANNDFAVVRYNADGSTATEGPTP